MTSVDVSAEGIDLPTWSEKCRIFAEKALKKSTDKPNEISIVLCSNDFIHQLNRNYWGKDEPTDVLSFPQDEGDGPDGLAGDIVIALEAVSENADYFGVPFEEEVKRVIIHGILHLLGWDHSDNSPDQEMLKLQEKILNDLGGERLL